MRVHRFIILSILLFFSLPYIYGGCVVIFSSGDIDKDTKNKEQDTSTGFIGVSSHAAINSTNADKLVGKALTVGRTTIEAAALKKNKNEYTGNISVFRPLRLPQVLGGALLKIELSPTIIDYSRADDVTDSGRFIGSCGGNFSYELIFSKDSEEFSGQFYFENYCDRDIAISGGTNVEGNFNAEIGSIQTVEFSFDDLADDSHVFEGGISIDYSDSPILALFDAYSTHAGSGEVFRARDYSMNITELAGHVEIEVFGSFYHPEYGNIDLKTADPFSIQDDDEWPVSGQFVIRGARNTKARLTAIDQLHVVVAADTDGDGLYDWDSGILNWDDL